MQGYPVYEQHIAKHRYLTALAFLDLFHAMLVVRRLVEADA